MLPEALRAAPTSPAAAILVPILVLWIVMITVDTLGRAHVLGRATKPVDFMVNMVSWGVEAVARNLTFPIRFALFVGLSMLSPFTVSMGVFAWVALFVGVDFCYYWKHRWLHTTAFGWALHQPHHSVREVTIESALRLGWMERQVDDFFYIPLVLVGFDPWLVLLMVEVVHMSQWWCHNEWMGRLPSIERWVNTPALHRAHHARSPTLHDSNYGAATLVWDQLFGTYRLPPDEPFEFGADIGYDGRNPLRFQFIGLWRWAGFGRPTPSEPGEPAS